MFNEDYAVLETLIGATLLNVRAEAAPQPAKRKACGEEPPNAVRLTFSNGFSVLFRDRNHYVVYNVAATREAFEREVNEHVEHIKRLTEARKLLKQLPLPAKKQAADADEEEAEDYYSALDFDDEG